MKIVLRHYDLTYVLYPFSIDMTLYIYNNSTMLIYCVTFLPVSCLTQLVYPIHIICRSQHLFRAQRIQWCHNVVAGNDVCNHQWISISSDFFFFKHGCLLDCLPFWLTLAYLTVYAKYRFLSCIRIFLILVSKGPDVEMACMCNSSYVITRAILYTAYDAIQHSRQPGGIPDYTLSQIYRYVY